jgi:hypothetical protein
MASSPGSKKAFHNKAPDGGCSSKDQLLNRRLFQPCPWQECEQSGKTENLNKSPQGHKKCPCGKAGHGGKLFGRTFGVQSLRGKWLCTKKVPLCGEPVPEVLLSRLPLLSVGLYPAAFF